MPNFLLESLKQCVLGFGGGIWGSGQQVLYPSAGGYGISRPTLSTYILEDFILPIQTNWNLPIGCCQRTSGESDQVVGQKLVAFN